VLPASVGDVCIWTFLKSGWVGHQAHQRQTLETQLQDTSLLCYIAHFILYCCDSLHMHIRFASFICLNENFYLIGRETRVFWQENVVLL
jgi:hypothetical protein